MDKKISLNVEQHIAELISDDRERSNRAWKDLIEVATVAAWHKVRLSDWFSSAEEGYIWSTFEEALNESQYTLLNSLKEGERPAESVTGYFIHMIRNITIYYLRKASRHAGQDGGNDLENQPSDVPTPSSLTRHDIDRENIAMVAGNALGKFAEESRACRLVKRPDSDLHSIILQILAVELQVADCPTDDINQALESAARALGKDVQDWIFDGAKRTRIRQHAVRRIADHFQAIPMESGKSLMTLTGSDLKIDDFGAGGFLREYWEADSSFCCPSLMKDRDQIHPSYALDMEALAWAHRELIPCPLCNPSSAASQHELQRLQQISARSVERLRS